MQTQTGKKENKVRRVDWTTLKGSKSKMHTAAKCSRDRERRLRSFGDLLHELELAFNPISRQVALAVKAVPSADGGREGGRHL